MSLGTVPEKYDSSTRNILHTDDRSESAHGQNQASTSMWPGKAVRPEGSCRKEMLYGSACQGNAEAEARTWKRTERDSLGTVTFTVSRQL